MKKVILKSAFLILALSTLIVNQSKAQAKLGVVAIYNFPKTPRLGDTANFNITIQNKGNQAYSGPFSLQYNSANDSTIFYVSSSTYSVTLNPNDTVLVPASIIIDPGRFKIGIDIVVVWPISNVATSDSASVSITVLGSLGVIEKDSSLEEAVTIYPNPANHALVVNVNAKNRVERVRIIDVFGAEIFEANTSHQTNLMIQTTAYPPGVYFMELMLEDNKRLVRKFMKN